MSWSEDRSAHLPSSEQHVKEESQWATKTRAMLGWNPTSWKSNRCQPRRERERERISDGKDADLIKQVSAQQRHCLSSHPNHEEHPRCNERSFYSSLDIFKAFPRLFHFQAQNAESCFCNSTFLSSSDNSTSAMEKVLFVVWLKFGHLRTFNYIGNLQKIRVF